MMADKVTYYRHPIPRPRRSLVRALALTAWAALVALL
jgi:hypothetical protein